MTWFDSPFMRNVLLAGTVVWSIVGVGLWTQVSIAPDPLPPDLIIHADFIMATGQNVGWDFAPVGLRFYQDRIYREVTGLRGFFKELSQELTPVTLQINMQNLDRVVISDRMVEIGFTVAKCEGQVRHALLKVWFLQIGRGRLGNSLFRQEVLADAFSAIAEGELRLREPQTGALVRYEEVGDEQFFKQVATFRSVCQSKWRPVAFRRFCESSKNINAVHLNEISQFSLRQLLGITIWRTYRELSSLERIRFQRGWLQYLKNEPHFIVNTNASGETVDRGETDSALFSFHRWARRELDDLLPENPARLGFGSDEKIAGQYRIARKAAVATAALEQKNEMKVDVVAQFERQRALSGFVEEVIEAKGILALPRDTISIVGHNGKHFLLPGRVALSAADLSRVFTRSIVWDSCAPPDAMKVLKYPIRSERVLIVKNCSDEGSDAHYRSFVRYGVEGFAIDNPNLHFAQVHRATLDLALQRGILPGFNLFAEIFISTASVSRPEAQVVAIPLKVQSLAVDRLLGLGTAQWSPSLRAYRSRGAIEAIEWFRGEGLPFDAHL